MNEIKISVIIPIYNSEKYLHKTIKSVIDQTCRRIEIICVDDGSNDSSLEICNEFKRNDDRIVVVEQKNKGVSSARNSGLKIAKGEFIIFLDSDDCYDINAFDSMYNDIVRNNVDVVFYNLVNDYNGKFVIRNCRIKDGIYKVKEIEDILLDDGSITGILFGSSCSAIYKRNIIRNNKLAFDIDLSVNEDGFFNLEYILKSNKIMSCSNKKYYFYRQTSLNDKNKDYIDSLDKAYKYSYNYKFIDGFSKQIKNRYATILFQKSFYLAQKGSIMVARKALFDLWITKELYTYENERINIYKKILMLCIKKQYYIFFILVIRYIYPVVARFIRR